jgi:hypothetical protein
MEGPVETRKHPYGRRRQDTVAQPFLRLSLAERFADMMERMTGEACAVVSRGPTWHIVFRKSVDGKQVRV